MNPLLFTIGCVVVLCMFFYITERLLIKINFSIPNEVLGIYFNVVGVLYTLILAFVVVTVWQGYDENVVAVENEAHQLLDIRIEAENIPAHYEEPIEAAIISYARAVHEDEWPKLAERKVSALEDEKMDVLLQLRQQMKKDSLYAEDCAEMIDYIKEARECRHYRLLLTHSSLPDIMWVVLIIGSVICVFLSFLIHVKDMFWQMVLTTLMTSVLAMVLYLLFALSHPYSGNAMIDSHPFEEVELGGHSH